MPLLIAAGEVFHDLIFYDLAGLPRLGEELKTDSFRITVGGGAAITAAAAARLGRSAEVVTVWGDSPLDIEACERLRKLGVGLGRSAIRQGERAGLTVSVSTRDDRYFLTNPGANCRVEGYLLRADTFNGLEAGDHVHFALTPSKWQPFEDLIQQLKKRSVTTSWDLGWDPQAASGDAFTSLSANLEVLFLNEMEALRYTGSQHLDQALGRFSEQPNTIVVKLGSRGAVACHGGRQVWAEPVRVNALETTGAGDAFNGGFLHERMNGSGLPDCLLTGNICGALSTRVPGGIDSLPSGGEVKRRRSAARKQSQPDPEAQKARS